MNKTRTHVTHDSFCSFFEKYFFRICICSRPLSPSPPHFSQAKDPPPTHQMPPFLSSSADCPSLPRACSPSPPAPHFPIRNHFINQFTSLMPLSYHVTCHVLLTFLLSLCFSVPVSWNFPCFIPATL